MKSIEEKSDLLTKQIAFAKHFLRMLGITSTVGGAAGLANEMNYKHEILIDKNENDESKTEKLDYFDDSFYLSFNQINGLKLDKINKKEGINIMNGILQCMIELINKRLIINEDLLIMCLIYSNAINSSSLFDTLITCANECLGVSNTNYKSRSYHYFKQFFTFSTIWNLEYSGNLLFDKLENIVDKQLLKQKEIIWKCIENEEKNNNKAWNDLCNFGVNYIKKDDVFELRQNKIEKGIQPLYSENELYLINCRMSESNNYANYDVFAEYNNAYLTQC